MTFRYISREIQRQFARVLVEAEADLLTLERTAVAIQNTNGSYPNAFRGYLEKNGIYIHPDLG